MEKKKKKNKLVQELYKHVMTGISYMIPVLIMGGLIGAFSQIIPYVIYKVNPDISIIEAINSGKFTGFSLIMMRLADLMAKFGFTLFGFAIPIFSAFTANSIGGRTALIGGFIGGYIANKPIELLKLLDGKWEGVTPVPSGFLGAILIAFAVGYFVKFLNKKIQMPHNWLAFKSTFLVPLLAASLCMFLMIFVITPIGGWINLQIKNILEAAGKAGELGYALALAGTTSFDLGGPVNKAAGFVALAFTQEKILPITARTIAIVTPSIGLGFSTLIDKKLVGKKVYEEQFYELGKTSMFLAFMGISEGAIPFALERPSSTIPIYVTGSILGALTGILMGAVQWFPESAIWAWPLLESASGKPWAIFAYIVGILVGSLFIAVVTVYYRNSLIKRGKLIIEED